MRNYALSSALVLCTTFAVAQACAQDSPFADANSLVWRAEALEEQGKITEAWFLYAQAANLDPKNLLASGKASQLRSKALEKASFAAGKDAPVEVNPNDPLVRITDGDMGDIARLLPPPALEPKPGKITLNLSGDAKTIYQRVLGHFGIDLIFDGDYDNPSDRQVKLEDASFDEALYVVNLVTNSFVNPLSEKLAMIVRDTDQKRREQERNVAITLPITTAISSPEAQEVARAVQQIFELQRVSIDTVRGMMMIRDRWSKVKPAQAALSQLLQYRGQVMLDVEFYEVSEQSTLSFGFSLPNSSQLIPLVKSRSLITAPLNGIKGLLTFGGGTTLFGLGVTSASLFASMTHSNTKSLYEAKLRSLDGLPATIHIGDRFPIITATSSYSSGTNPNAQLTAPQIQFEDLGLSVKITPHMHANGEISLELESEFKVLTGQTNNDIPVIANRKYTGTVRLKEGEWAVAAGLTTRSDSRNRIGIAGLSQIPLIGPLFALNGHDHSSGQTLLVVRPHTIGTVPAEYAGRELFTGPETRFLAPVR